MTFKEYVDSLNEFLATHPEAANLDAIYASDDEGNEFRYVWSEPSLCYYYNDELDAAFPEDFNEYEIDKPNAVCIN